MIVSIEEEGKKAVGGRGKGKDVSIEKEGMKEDVGMGVNLSIFFYRYTNAAFPHNRGLHNTPQKLSVQFFGHFPWIPPSIYHNAIL